MNRERERVELLRDAADYIRTRSGEIADGGGSADVADDGMRIALGLEAVLTALPPGGMEGVEDHSSVAGEPDGSSELPHHEQAGSATPSEARFSAPHLRPGAWFFDGICKVWAPSLKGGHTPVCDIRGWGYLTGGGHGALGLPEEQALETQLAWGHLIAKAVNAHFGALEPGASKPADTREARLPEGLRATEHKSPPTEAREG